MNPTTGPTLTYRGFGSARCASTLNPLALSTRRAEELGVVPTLRGIVGAYGGAALETTYLNGDRVGYVTVAYSCSVPQEDFVLERAELLEARWVSRAAARGLDRHAWIDQVLDDAMQWTVSNGQR